MPETIESEQQADRIQAAIDVPISMGPGFLNGDVAVKEMTDAMIAAVHSFQAEEEAAGRGMRPLGTRSVKLFPVLQELIACGGGFQAGRCDADCVARTMTSLVREFGDAEKA
ncbi:hypothetical protein [Gordonia phthalatica]|nr:hypothetical protein [Gordonia phthalatica]